MISVSLNETYLYYHLLAIFLLSIFVSIYFIILIPSIIFMFFPCILELIVDYIYLVYDFVNNFEEWLMDILDGMFKSGDDQRLPVYLLIHFYAQWIGFYWQIIDDWFFDFYKHMLSDDVWFIRQIYYCLYPFFIIIQIYFILTNNIFLLFICVLIPICLFIYIYYR